MIYAIGWSLLLGAVTWRVTRFIILDTLLERPRDRWLSRLQVPSDSRLGTFLRYKLFQLFACPFCMSIWVSAGAVALTRWLATDVALPVWTWLGAATVCMFIWNYIDSEPDE